MEMGRLGGQEWKANFNAFRQTKDVGGSESDAAASKVILYCTPRCLQSSHCCGRKSPSPTSSTLPVLRLAVHVVVHGVQYTHNTNAYCKAGRSPRKQTVYGQGTGQWHPAAVLGKLAATRSASESSTTSWEVGRTCTPYGMVPGRSSSGRRGVAVGIVWPWVRVDVDTLGLAVLKVPAQEGGLERRPVDDLR
jgi:hypothetical protein